MSSVTPSLPPVPGPEPTPGGDSSSAKLTSQGQSASKLYQIDNLQNRIIIVKGERIKIDDVVGKKSVFETDDSGKITGVKDEELSAMVAGYLSELEKAKGKPDQERKIRNGVQIDITMGPSGTDSTKKELQSIAIRVNEAAGMIDIFSFNKSTNTDADKLKTYESINRIYQQTESYRNRTDTSQSAGKTGTTAASQRFTTSATKSAAANEPQEAATRVRSHSEAPPASTSAPLSRPHVRSASEGSARPSAPLSPPALNPQDNIETATERAKQLRLYIYGLQGDNPSATPRLTNYISRLNYIISTETRTAKCIKEINKIKAEIDSTTSTGVLQKLTATLEDLKKISNLDNLHTVIGSINDEIQLLEVHIELLKGMSPGDHLTEAQLKDLDTTGKVKFWSDRANIETSRAHPDVKKALHALLDLRHAATIHNLNIPDLEVARKELLTLSTQTHLSPPQRARITHLKNWAEANVKSIKDKGNSATITPLLKIKPRGAALNAAAAQLTTQPAATAQSIAVTGQTSENDLKEKLSQEIKTTIAGLTDRNLRTSNAGKDYSSKATINFLESMRSQLGSMQEPNFTKNLAKLAWLNQFWGNIYQRKTFDEAMALASKAAPLPANNPDGTTFDIFRDILHHVLEIPTPAAFEVPVQETPPEPSAAPAEPSPHITPATPEVVNNLRERLTSLYRRLPPNHEDLPDIDNYLREIARGGLTEGRVEVIEKFEDQILSKHNLRLEDIIAENPPDRKAQFEETLRKVFDLEERLNDLKSAGINTNEGEKLLKEVSLKLDSARDNPEIKFDFSQIERNLDKINAFIVSKERLKQPLPPLPSSASPRTTAPPLPPLPPGAVRTAATTPPQPAFAGRTTLGPLPQPPVPPRQTGATMAGVPLPATPKSLTRDREFKALSEDVDQAFRDITLGKAIKLPKKDPNNASEEQKYKFEDITQEESTQYRKKIDEYEARLKELQKEVAGKDSASIASTENQTRLMILNKLDSMRTTLNELFPTSSSRPTAAATPLTAEQIESERKRKEEIRKLGLTPGDWKTKEEEAELPEEELKVTEPKYAEEREFEARISPIKTLMLDANELASKLIEKEASLKAAGVDTTKFAITLGRLTEIDAALDTYERDEESKKILDNPENVKFLMDFLLSGTVILQRLQDLEKGEKSKQG